VGFIQLIESFKVECASLENLHHQNLVKKARVFVPYQSDGTTTLSIMTLSIIALSIPTFSIKLIIMTLSIIALSIPTFSIKLSIMTLSLTTFMITIKNVTLRKRQSVNA
jgi:hypothetical protein